MSYEFFAKKFDKWLPIRPLVDLVPPPQPYKLSGPNVQPINLDLYGDSVDLNDLKNRLEVGEITFTDNGAAINPEPVPEVDPPPTQEELDAHEFFKQAFNEEMDSLEAAVMLAIQTRYDVLNTTGIAFADVKSKSHLKHLKQRVN